MSSQSSKKKNNNNAVSVLKEVLGNHVKIPDEQRKKTVKIIEDFVKTELVEKRMKAGGTRIVDAPGQFVGVLPTGSFYERLRVNNALEFDLNLVFRTPKGKKTLMEQETRVVDPDFVKIRVGDNDGVPGKFLEEDPSSYARAAAASSYLMADKVRNWMEGLVERVLDGLTPRELLARYGIAGLSTRKSGPAMTLRIEMEVGGEIMDVDLVPAFIFEQGLLSKDTAIGKEMGRMSAWSLEQRGRTGRGKPQNKKNNNNKKKNAQGRPQAGCRQVRWMRESIFGVPKKSSNSDVDPRLWRLAFPEQERKILNGPGKNCVKPVVKLLKSFRDHNEPIREISSYALKTVVMQMMKERNGDFEVWRSETNLAELFIQALRKLHDFMDRGGGVPHIFDDRCDVLRMNGDTVDNMKNWLHSALVNLESSKDDGCRCRSTWLAYFPLC